MSLILLRHPAVALAWAGRCYGASDVPLSRAGRASITTLAHDPAWAGVAAVIHSDLGRTRLPAQAIAMALGVPLIADAGWRERDFGAWEGKSWHAIWRESGSAMDGMIDGPGDFRPGGSGETTHELRDRVLAAAARAGEGGRHCLVVTHGGPIAALAGTLAGMAVRDWLPLVPACGEWRRLDWPPAG